MMWDHFVSKEEQKNDIAFPQQNPFWARCAYAVAEAAEERDPTRDLGEGGVLGPKMKCLAK